VSFLSQ